MEDKKIIDLYWARIEDAIRATGEKYGRLCHYIASNILASREDCEECINDTYLGLWNAIPPERPARFSVFVSRITRNLALKKYDYLSAAKRNSDAMYSLEELEDCVSGEDTVESELENKRIETAIDDFLWQQEEDKRHVFILRYWYFASIEDISRRTGFSQSKVKSMLYHLRKSLRAHLEKEEIDL